MHHFLPNEIIGLSDQAKACIVKRFGRFLPILAVRVEDLSLRQTGTLAQHQAQQPDG